MRAQTLRTYKTVHTWVGIVSGMALFIAFYAGALTIFKEPLARWVSPPQAGSVQDVPLEQVPSLIAQTLAAHPQAAKDFRVHLQPGEHLPARLTWQERVSGTPQDDHHEGDVRHYAASLDAQGRARVEEVHPSGVAKLIDNLHRVVGLPADTDPNRWVMGVVAALYGLALVSGVVVLLPTLVKDFFALRLGRNLKRMWLDAHNVVGIISLPFHVVMALTAAVFAFHDGIYASQDKLVHDGTLAAMWRAGAARPTATGPRDPAAMLPPAELLQRLKAVAPAFEPRTLQYTRVTSPQASVRVWGTDATGIARSVNGGFASLDPYSGRISETTYLPGHQGAAAATLTSFFTLHFGSYGGAPVAWAYFLMGLAGAFLFYSGNLLWIESRRKTAGKHGPVPEQKRNTAWMAAATVGVCLGCIAGLSATVVVGKWLRGLVDDLDAWHMGVYYAVFLGSIGWAFVRGAARASVHLLGLAAAATAAIPLTSLLGWLVPATGWWAHASGPALGVDAVAAVGALCYAWMARATARRVARGRTDSVWSARAPQAEAPSAAAAEAA